MNVEDLTNSKKYDWYWSNYKTGMDWIKRHEIAYWKSQAQAYRDENRRLLNTLHTAVTNNEVRVPPMGLQRASSTSSRKHRKRKRNVVANKKRVIEDDSELEVTDELINFLKISMEHKKAKEMDAERLLSSFLPPQDIMDMRQKEMKELYGDGSDKILGMETVMTLAFDRFVDQRNPQYWPSSSS